MIGALLVAAALIAVSLLTMEITADVGEPGFFVLALGVALVCAALALVVFVLRGSFKPPVRRFTSMRWSESQRP
ncbi:hypothetical protein D9V28_02060 [Mycetocola zhadangensis]|uniref:Uncharacterized protein n=2 Tax=Mycetocola zhadangensis TaxID=1164595 RepID=A0A3L7J511_9MICO|nr:hypothetical protein D9V28_02060 [Mycetocola zhadangensis]GGE84792.1 hypothetical protein GCM10011313_04070 [Mycetocola zhadangensis]